MDYFFWSSFPFEILKRLMIPAGCSALSNLLPTTFRAALVVAVGVGQLADWPAHVTTLTELANWLAQVQWSEHVETCPAHALLTTAQRHLALTDGDWPPLAHQLDVHPLVFVLRGLTVVEQLEMEFLETQRSVDLRQAQAVLQGLLESAIVNDMALLIVQA